MGLNKSISSRLISWEEVIHFGRRIIVDISKSFNVGKPLDIASIVLKPDGGVESHFVVLSEGGVTI